VLILPDRFPLPSSLHQRLEQPILGRLLALLPPARSPLLSRLHLHLERPMRGQHPASTAPARLPLHLAGRRMFDPDLWPRMAARGVRFLKLTEQSMCLCQWTMRAQLTL
jgi:hypothetical protein